MPQLTKYMDLVSIIHTSGTQVAEIDTANAEGVMFIAIPGTTAARTLSMAFKTGASTTGFVNCSSTHTYTSTAANLNILVADVHKPAKRWLGATVSSSVLTESWLLAFKYGLRKDVVAFSSTAKLGVVTSVKRIVSPSSAT